MTGETGSWEGFSALVTALGGLAVTGWWLVAGLLDDGVLRLSARDEPDFGESLATAYRRHYPSFVAYAARHGARGAEDVVQQAFEKVWQRRPRQVANVDAYVQTSVRHETWRALGRTRADDARYGGDVAESAFAGRGDAAQHVADRLTLHQLLGRLTRREREAVVLRTVWTLSVREAAEAMDVSEGAVKRYCADGLRRLGGWLAVAA